MMKIIKHINNLIFLLLLFLLLILIFHYFSKKSSIENYRGLSKVPEFEALLEKKYTKVDKEAKTVTYCIKKSSTNVEGEESVDETCRSMNYNYHFNNPNSVKLVKDKIETSKILQASGIPVPKFFKFTFEPMMDNVAALEKLKSEMTKNNISYPIVLKQIHGTFGIDVYTHIENDAIAEKRLQMFKEKGYKEIMCEEQIEGHCYRIFVFNKTIIDVIKREAPYVTGDGVNTIRSLITMRNKKQLEKKLFETKNLSEDYMQKLGYKMDDILPKGKNLIITTVINMHNGANISRVPIGKIPKINQDIFIKTNDVLGIMTSGIDFLSNDITVPYNQNNGRILEVNGTPDTEIHTIVSSQTNDSFNIYEKIADIVFMN